MALDKSHDQDRDLGPALDKAQAMGVGVVAAELEKGMAIELPSSGVSPEPERNRQDGHDAAAEREIRAEMHAETVCADMLGMRVGGQNAQELLAALSPDILAECVKSAHGVVDGLDHFMGFDNFPDGVHVTPDAVAATQPRDAGLQIG